MSGFVEVRSYFRTALVALGFKEWTDAFNVDNIPSTILDKSFHLSAPSGSRRGGYDQQKQDAETSVAIRIARKGYKNPANAIDQCLVDVDAIITQCLDITRRNESGIKNVYNGGHSITALDASNDNVAVLEINFTCFIILKV